MLSFPTDLPIESLAGIISSPATMISVIRKMGIVPFSHCAVIGWSIEEMTNPEWWFTTSDELGPWDWKVDAVQTGDIVYGKFLRRKAAFATVEYYRHLMNWRRSIPQFRMALGESYDAVTIDDRLMQLLAPVVLSALRECGTLQSDDIRQVLENIPIQDRERIGGHVVKYLVPHVKKQAVDYVMQYLEMGTWAVVGDITRVYRGPNLEYCGWQRNVWTTPEELYGNFLIPGNGKNEATIGGVFHDVHLLPARSREFLLDKVVSLFPETRSMVMKLI